MGVMTSSVFWIEDDHEITVSQGCQMIEVELYKDYRIDFLSIYAKPEKMEELIRKIKEAADGTTGQSETSPGDQQEGL